MAEKVKRYLLENDPVETFEFIGICTAQSDFRLAWQLNTRFNIFLEKSNELIEVPIKKTKEFDRYNFYSYHDRQNLISYFLIRNKQEGHILLSEK